MKTRTAQSVTVLAMAQTLLLVLVVAGPWCAPSLATPGEQNKKVLLFFSDHSDARAQGISERTMRSTLNNGSPVPLEIYSEYLDSVRTRPDNYEKELVDFLRRKYEGWKFDVVISFSTSALRLLLQHRTELFGETPMVFLVLDRRVVADLELGPDLTGLWTEQNFKPNLELALELQPETKKVAVVAGLSEFDKFWTAKAQEDFRAYEDRLEFTYFIGLTASEQQNALANLPSHSIVFYISSMLDNAGNHYRTMDFLSEISPSSNAPIFGCYDSDLGSGIVGGRLISFEAIGTQVAELGLRVLGGEKAQGIAPHGIASVRMFDWRELQRWGMSERNLPSGSIVRFKEPSLWERYKWHIVGIISLCLLEALLIAWLLFTRALRRKALKESERFALLAKSEREHLDEVVSNVPGVVWESRIESGTNTRKIHFVNEYVEKMFGYSVEECLAHTNFWLSIILEEDREEAVRNVEAILAGGRVGVNRCRCVTKAGPVIWIEAHIATICDETGKRVGLRGVAMDITARKLAEDALQESLSQVRRLQDQLQQENISLKREIELEHDFHEIIGQSDEIKYVFYKIEQVAAADTTVLISGETGTGKELVARAIHSASHRKDRPLIKINCATLPASLIESELFGHERGAFTGAQSKKLGRFEIADRATLFLDEIGELPLELQPKLLRVLQDGEFERLGGSRTINVDVRVIAATNRDLKREIEEGRFREDLFYRLNVFPITVPPLRQRQGDIPLLIKFFVNKFNRKLGRSIDSVPPAAMSALQSYRWPGNIRELANVIERAVLNTPGATLRVADNLDGSQPACAPSVGSTNLIEIERAHIMKILETTNWKIEGQAGAAQILGLNASTLRTRLNKLGIRRPVN